LNFALSEGSVQEKINDRLLFNLPVAGILQRWMLARDLALLGNHVPESDTGGELRHRRCLELNLVRLDLVAALKNQQLSDFMKLL